MDVDLTDELVADLVAQRPYDTPDNPVLVPSDYDPATPVPLVLALHGVGWTGQAWRRQSGLGHLVDEYGFILASPDGNGGSLLLVNTRGWDFSCCGQFAGALAYDFDTDEVAYLRAVIADLESRYNIDPDRVYIQGHSMGALMAYTFACRAPDEVAAIAPLAGTMLANEVPHCNPTDAVAVMHAHGDEDGTVSYTGGSLLGITPPTMGVEDLTDIWGCFNDCDSSAIAETADLLDALEGEETAVTRYQGCNRETSLWTIEEGLHIPLPETTTDADVDCEAPSPETAEYCETRYARAVMDFFYENPKP